MTGFPSWLSKFRSRYRLNLAPAILCLTFVGLGLVALLRREPHAMAYLVIGMVLVMSWARPGPVSLFRLRENPVSVTASGGSQT